MKATYTYLSDGTKAGAVDDNGNGFDYLGSMVYNNNNGTKTLESSSFGGGRINKSNSDYEIDYFITDHLGSTRVIVDNAGNIKEQNDYYPFGLKHDNANLVSSGNRYRFVGAEMQVIGIVGDIDLGARNYDPFTGRTRTQDRFSEKYYGLSQYGYAANSPVNIIDINGDSIWYTKNENVITMHVTGKVINQSSDNIDVNRAANDIAGGIAYAFSGKLEIDGVKYTLETNVQLEAVNSMDDVAGSDHLFVISDTDGKTAGGVTNEIGGKVMTISARDYANDNWFSKTFSSNNILSAVHEFGHAAGLTHYDATSKKDLMWSGSDGTNVTSRQRELMLFRQHTINKGPNSLNGKPYPYVHAKDKTGKWVTSTAYKLLNIHSKSKR